MPFEIKLEQFSGPLQLLLELIEQEKLPITEVSLAKVTEDFLRHIDEREVPPEELADFLVVATRLLLIKSRAILPKPAEPEEDGSRLADQLRMYKQFVDAAEVIERMFLSDNVMFSRERATIIRTPGFVAPSSVTPTVLFDAFQSLLKRLEPFFSLRRASLERVVSVQERMVHLRDVIMERSKLAFRDMVGSATTKVEVVVSFLALLELMKQRVVKAVQGGAFNDIVITKTD